VLIGCQSVRDSGRASFRCGLLFLVGKLENRVPLTVVIRDGVVHLVSTATRAGFARRMERRRLESRPKASARLDT
jgi:hypothetical protein